MTPSTSWQENNARQLSSALAELRQRLENFCQRSNSPNGDASPSAEPTPAPEREPAPETPSALEILGDRLGLSAFERNVLLLCAAAELDTPIASNQGNP